ncbi:MAG: hypothetical protein IH946_12885 [Bacteroidetes bacterium]|nr:hypothetical protein [Bacteroidota bacterium]
MEDITTQIDRIITKANTLLQNHKELQSKVVTVEQENESLTEQLKQADTKIRLLESDLNMVKLGSDVELNPEDKRQFKLKINEYIREIDKCLALLNN